jgi:hypothetical protein
MVLEGGEVVLCRHLTWVNMIFSNFVAIVNIGL